jgi:hypothetical protein
MPGLCTRLHKLGVLAPARFPGESRELNQVLANAEALLAALAGNRNFRRDSTLASLFHGRKVSFREVSPWESLHVVFHGDVVSAHVDLLSPLNFDPQRSSQYSPARVVAHNVVGLVGNLVRLISRGVRLGAGFDARVGTAAHFRGGFGARVEAA